MVRSYFKMYARCVKQINPIQELNEDQWEWELKRAFVENWEHLCENMPYIDTDETRVILCKTAREHFIEYFTWKGIVDAGEWCLKRDDSHYPDRPYCCGYTIDEPPFDFIRREWQYAYKREGGER